MQSPEVKALAKQHGPTLAIAAVVVAAVKLSAPTGTPVTVQAPQLAEHAGSGTAQTSRLKHDEGVETRLVSCGGRGASIVGDAQHSTDELGAVTLGAEPKGTCTIIFAGGTSHHCAVNGGHIAKTLATEIVVDHIEGPTFAYRCEP